jgi:SPP1 gp7 family putative phage head morphogenesis protein
VTISQWRKRIEKLEGNGHELVLETIEKCEKEHGNCCENVCDAISAWFGKYATDGRVSYIEAVRFNRMLELIDCINDDLEVATEEEDHYISLLVGGLLGLYSTKLGIDLTLDMFKAQWSADGIWYSDNLKENKTTLLFYIRNDIKQALARGDKLPEVLTQVRKRFKSSTSGLGSLIQTRSTDYESDILKNWLIANGHSKYVWITIQDGRQCDDCDAMDGLIFDVKDYERGVTAPALHRRCRCQIAPAD